MSITGPYVTGERTLGFTVVVAGRDVGWSLTQSLGEWHFHFYYGRLTNDRSSGRFMSWCLGHSEEVV